MKKVWERRRVHPHYTPIPNTQNIATLPKMSKTLYSCGLMKAGLGNQPPAVDRWPAATFSVARGSIQTKIQV